MLRRVKITGGVPPCRQLAAARQMQWKGRSLLIKHRLINAMFVGTSAPRNALGQYSLLGEPLKQSLRWFWIPWTNVSERPVSIRVKHRGHWGGQIIYMSKVPRNVPRCPTVRPVDCLLAAIKHIAGKGWSSGIEQELRETCMWCKEVQGKPVLRSDS